MGLFSLAAKGVRALVQSSASSKKKKKRKSRKHSKKMAIKKGM